jgi:hypothetical protein
MVQSGNFYLKVVTFVIEYITMRFDPDHKLTLNTSTSARCIYTWLMQINVNEKGMITTVAEYSAVNTLVLIYT